MDRAVTAPLAHRGDIDGLRALAILPILFLHCGLPGLRGGFVGVDVFFVISGYLITAIIGREMAEGHFTLMGFYRRRIVRILPALAVMMVVMLGVALLTMWPVRLRDLGQSVTATSAFASNIYFYFTADYFAQASDAKPLVHTWSLAVEEQFYLIYPLLLSLLVRRPMGEARRWVIGASVLSLLGGWAWGLADSTGAFFLLPSRIWELMAGALVALGAVKLPGDGKLRDGLSLAALAAIGGSCVLLKATWSFPSPTAVPAVAGAALLIALGPDTVAARILSWMPFRMVGLISYSVYLWHRPIIAFYEMNQGVEWASWTAKLTLFALCLLAGALSYWLVEKPALRRWRHGKSRAPHAAALIGLVGMALVGQAVAANSEHIRPIAPDVRRIVSYLDWDKTPAGERQFSSGHCFILPTDGSPDDRADHLACVTPQAGQRHVMLVGDSHAAQLSQALREALATGPAPAQLLQVTAAGCRPLIEGPGLPRCRRIHARGFALVAAHRVDEVILAGRWAPNEIPNLLATIHTLQADGIRVTVVGPMVEYDADMPSLLGHAWEKADRGGADPLASHRLMDRIALDREMTQAMQGKDVTFVSATALECPDGRCRMLASDGAPIHFDHSHLTPGGARDLVAAILAMQKR